MPSKWCRRITGTIIWFATRPIPYCNSPICGTTGSPGGRNGPTTLAYNDGTWVKYNGFIWSANTNLAAGQAPPSFSNSNWSEQADISTSTAQDLGAYPGNYILSWEAMFDPDDAAALFTASYATNGPITSDGTYSGISYYLIHSLRGLGDQDTNYYSDIPTSQIYYNPRTGARTSLIYNPSTTTQTATIYSNGTPVNTLSVAPGTLTVHASPIPGSFGPTLARNIQLSWPTTVGNDYQVQWTTPLVNTNSTWNDLTGVIPGDGTTNTMFDPLGADGARAYQVLEYTTYVASNIVNGGFETGHGFKRRQLDLFRQRAALPRQHKFSLWRVVHDAGQYQ